MDIVLAANRWGSGQQLALLVGSIFHEPQFRHYPSKLTTQPRLRECRLSTSLTYHIKDFFRLPPNWGRNWPLIRSSVLSQRTHCLFQQSVRIRINLRSFANSKYALLAATFCRPLPAFGGVKICHSHGTANLLRFFDDCGECAVVWKTVNASALACSTATVVSPTARQKAFGTGIGQEAKTERGIRAAGDPCQISQPERYARRRNWLAFG